MTEEEKKKEEKRKDREKIKQEEKRKEREKIEQEEKRKELEEIKQEYLAAYRLAQNDPALLAEARKFDRKVKNGEFRTAEDAKDYWKGVLDSSEWVQNQSNESFGSYLAEADPTMKGEVEAQRGAAELDVSRIADYLGIELDPARLGALTEKAWREAYDDDQIRDMLREDVANQLSESEDNLGFGGTIGDAAAELSAWATKNGFAIGQEDADRMLHSVAFGKKTLDQVKSELRTLYMVGAYPAWADMINAGIDIYELAAPYRSVATRMLGRPNIAMDDPVMKQMMQTQGGDGSFSQRPLWDAEKYIRGLDEWQYTDDAATTYAIATKAVGAMFGFG